MRKDWDIKTLKDIGFAQTGTTPNTSNNEYYGNFIPFIKPADIDFNGLGEIQYVNEGLSEKGFRIARIIPKNSILMVCIGASIGKVAYSNKEVTTNQQINSLTLKPGFCSKFFYYALTTSEFYQQVIKNSSQATLPIINKGKWEKLYVKFPRSLPEQQKIVSILDEAFAAIAKAKENTEKNLKNAKELFESYLQSVLNCKGEGWEEKKLGDVCFNVEYGSSSKSKATGKIPVLRMGNIQNRHFNWDDLVYTDDENEIKKYWLNYNDVLFNRTNSPELVGKSAIYKGEFPAIFAGYLIRLNIKKELIDPDYLNFYLNSKMVREYGYSIMSSSVNQANINGTKLKEYKILLPPLSVQQEISRKLARLTEETRMLETVYHQKIFQLEELKKSLLQKAFSGELTESKEAELV